MGCPHCGEEHPPNSVRCPAHRLGRLVDGRYRLEGLIGFGGMGAVYDALQVALGRRVALKMMLTRGARDAEALARFQREATAIAALRHPGIVQVQDLGSDADGSPFMVMERLTGKSVADLLDEGPLPIERAVWIAREALDALAVAHDHGLVHRDVKPSNLFVAEDGRGGRQVKLLDFGLAKVLEGEGAALTRTGMMMGSAPYMSPEQTEDSKRVDARTDVYAVGVTLFEMLTGYLPVSGDSDMAVLLRVAAGEITRNPRWIRREVPASLDAVVERALQRDPGRRHPTAREMAAALASADLQATAEDRAAEAALVSAPTLAGEPAPRPSRSRRTLAAPTLEAATLQAPPAPRRARRASWLVAAVVVLVAAGGAAVAVAVHGGGAGTGPLAAPRVPSLVGPVALPPSPLPSLPPPRTIAPDASAPPLAPEALEPVAPLTALPAPSEPAHRAGPSERAPANAPVPPDEQDEQDDSDEPDEPPQAPAPSIEDAVGAVDPHGPGTSIDRPLPGRPSNAQLRTALAPHRARITACAQDAPVTFSGVVSGPLGNLLNASVSLDPSEAACVRDALRVARFPTSRLPIYEFQLTLFP